MDLDGISYESPDFTKIIAPAIEQAPLFVFILTPNSQMSKYARNELLLAEKRKKHIFFVEPSECEMTSEFILEYGHYNRNLYYVDYQRQKLYKEIVRLLDHYEKGADIEAIESKSVEKNSLQKWLDECKRKDEEIAKKEEVERGERRAQKAEEAAEEERRRMMEKFRKKHGNKER